jgi:hypothetical protein
MPKTFNMKKYTILLLMLPLLALQCRKDKNDCPEGDKACELAKLSPLTTEGKGTFGCLVNGKAWLPESNSLNPRLRSIYYDEEHSYYQGANYDPENESATYVAFNISNFKLLAQTYLLEQYKSDTSSEGAYLECWDNDGCSRVTYQTNFEQTGILNVSYVDSAKQIISGTFNFVAKASSGETVCVTDGRYDMLFEVQ